MAIFNKNNSFINTVYRIFAIILCACLQVLYNSASDHTLSILLYPHAKLVELFYNIDLQYVKGTGYCTLNSIFTISRGCLGLNFIVLMFCMNVILFIHHFRTRKLLWFVGSLIGSAVIGVLVSGLRIIGSIPFVHHSKFSTIHTGIGISLYLLFFILTFIFIKKKDRSKFS